MGVYQTVVVAVTAFKWDGSNLEDIKTIVPGAFVVNDQLYLPTTQNPIVSQVIPMDYWVIHEDEGEEGTYTYQHPRDFTRLYELAP